MNINLTIINLIKSLDYHVKYSNIIYIVTTNVGHR